MVVLSTGWSGFEEVKTGEEIFGLRKAFAQSGSRSLAMNIRLVADELTKDLMVEFYRNVLSGKIDHCQALRQAALMMKQEFGENPYCWGPFVFVGQAD